MIKNPFRYSGPIIKDDPECGCSFVERIAINQTILRHIQQGNYVQIVGPHQSGRTTLAIDLIDKLLPKPDEIISPIPMLVSCESLVDACRECLIDTIMTRLRRVMREYLIEDTHSGLQSILAAPIQKTIRGFHEFLVAFGDKLKQSTKFSEIVIFLDEIEALPNELIVDVLSLFRAVYTHYAERRQEAPYRIIILTIHDLSYWDLGKRSPYNISNIVPLGPFSPQELDILLDKNHTEKVLKNIKFDDSSKHRIYNETGGHPYLIQRLCHILVNSKLDKTGAVVLTDSDVIKGVLELFESCDENLRRLNCESPPGSKEWELYRQLAIGHRVPFEADNTAIANLAQMGAISNVDHYCQISSRIYERQILKRHFREEFSQITDSFTEEERLLLHVSCIQKIFLNDRIGQLVFTGIEDLKQDHRKTDDEIATELLDYMSRVLEEQKCDLDMEEIKTYIDYYKIESVANREQVILILIKAFIICFNETTAIE